MERASNKTKLYVLFGCLALAVFIFGLAIYLAIQILLPAIVLYERRSPSQLVDTYPFEETTILINRIMLKLNHQWTIDDITIPHPLEDMAGRPESLVGASYGFASHIKNDLAFVQYNAFVYSDTLSAEENYLLQKEALLSPLRSGGKEPWHKLNLYSDINHYTACQHYQTLPIETRCIGLFTNKHYVAYINLWRVRDNIEYMSEQEMIVLFNEIILSLQ